MRATADRKRVSRGLASLRRKLEVDPAAVKLVFQGVSDADRRTFERLYPHSLTGVLVAVLLVDLIVLVGRQPARQHLGHVRIEAERVELRARRAVEARSSLGEPNGWRSWTAVPSSSPTT